MTGTLKELGKPGTIHLRSFEVLKNLNGLKERLSLCCLKKTLKNQDWMLSGGEFEEEQPCFPARQSPKNGMHSWEVDLGSPGPGGTQTQWAIPGRGGAGEREYGLSQTSGSDSVNKHLGDTRAGRDS